METQSLTVRVTDFIFDHIRRNQLGSGEELPSEVRTSTALNVSRGVVREAFRSLEVAGIIEKGNGRSPRVGSLNSSFLTYLLVHALLTRQVSLKQVLELRASVEVTAARLAAERCLENDVETLLRSAEGMRRSAADLNSFIQHDLQFHRTINGATGNPLFDVICGAMLESMRESMRAGMLLRQGSADILRGVENHEAIATAIEERDPALVELQMQRHFTETFLALDRIETGERSHLDLSYRCSV